MASSSSHPRNKYDVFLSFRGEETRHNFTSHLYEALCQKNIETFIDDQLIRGNEISKSLLDTIEASMISLIIFSEGYASSRWCLDELVKIFECKNQHGQIVIPVFYGVDPSHVRKQTEIFGYLFSKLEHQWGPEKMQIWRTVLTEAANLSGFDSHNIRLESKLIKEVVNHIMKSLAKVIPSDNKGHLVGVESTVKEIESLLELGSDLKKVCTLGISGIGGIGKTTIARAIFEKISNNFEGSCFLQNIREESQRPGGLSYLQHKLVSQLWRDENVIRDIDHLIFTRLCRKKVLIVLDDVTCLNQIESVIGRCDDQFMPQSRIIITTRNKQVLRNFTVEKIYEVNALGYHHALELFSRHAFQQNHPEIGYEEHSKKVIKYAKGVPLALKVLGHYLFKKETEVWESAINKLEKIPNQEIQEVLKLSYDALDDQEKNIFLDVACFLNGKHECFVMKFLNESGFYAEIGISVLVDKSLVIKEDNKITMHDLLQEMGREIVRQESSEDPEKRSRLWDHEDIIKVLKFNKGTEAIESICLDMDKVDKEICLNSDIFSKMPKLRFLKLYSSIENGGNKFKVSYFRGPGLAEVSSRHCERLQSIPKLPLNLLDLRTDGCTSLESVPALLSSNEYPELQYIHLAENFKLDGNEIVEDALQNLQLKATAHRKHVGKEVYYRGSRGYVLLPGNEIPRWFRYQSMGSSLSLKGTVPGLFNNNKVIGFAFSAVAFQPYHHVRRSWLDVYCQFKYESKDADRLDFEMRHGHLALSKSDHIHLGYYFFDYKEFNYFKQLNCLPDIFRIYFKEPLTLKPSDNLWVKKYGIHFFYISEDSFNCKEEEEPHPKRLKILEDI